MVRSILRLFLMSNLMLMSMDQDISDNRYPSSTFMHLGMSFSVLVNLLEDLNTFDRQCAGGEAN